VIGIAQSGFLHEIDDPVPAHLAAWWEAERPYCVHSAAWWRRHWERSGILDVSVADTLPDGWRYWRDWIRLVAPANQIELRALDADAGGTFSYVRAVGHRRPGVSVFDPNVTMSAEYTKQPLLRDSQEQTSL